MDLRYWIDTELESVGLRLASQVLDIVPVERWSESMEGSSSITYLLWHVARHHDLAVNAVLRQAPQVLDQHENVAAVLPPPGAGLAEAEDLRVTAALRPTAVADYHRAVLAGTHRWLIEADLAVLDRRVDGNAALPAAGVDDEEFGWLHRLWSDQTGRFFLQWEALGHELNHLGELVAIRNRMGLSPF